jgi:hypothetical protein
MEIRNLKLSIDGKSLYTFTVYLPEWHLSLHGCVKKGKKEGTEFICAYSKFDDGQWINHWQFDEEQHKRFIATVRTELKKAMNERGIKDPSEPTQWNVPL